MLNKVKNKIRSENGFSLLEVILSIAILTVVSVFILEMFVVSSRANHRAKDIDIGSAIAAHAVESLKACSAASDYFNSDYIINSQTAIGLSDFFVVNEKMDSFNVDFSKGVTVYKYYDSDWGEIKLTSAEAEPLNPVNINADFTVKLYLTVDERQAQIESGDLISVEASVLSLTKDGEGMELANYKNTCYFSKVGDIYGLQ